MFPGIHVKMYPIDMYPIVGPPNNTIRMGVALVVKLNLTSKFNQLHSFQRQIVNLNYFKNMLNIVEVEKYLLLGFPHST